MEQTNIQSNLKITDSLDSENSGIGRMGVLTVKTWGVLTVKTWGLLIVKTWDVLTVNVWVS
eukprot:624979-Amorphochlora_amoeboformis.AAC.1